MNTMNQTLLRSVLKIGAGVLLARGISDESTLETIIAGLTALVGVIWGVLQRRAPVADAPRASNSSGALPAFALLLLLSSAPLPLCAAAAASPADTITIPDQLFRAGEVQLDFFGTARTEDVTNLSAAEDGAGVGLNYFPWRAAGFGIEARGEGTGGLLVDNTAVALIGRFPIERFRLAPEFKIGADYQLRDRDWSVFAAAGLDLRFTKNLGLAAELRGVRPIAGAEHEHILALLKLRLAF